MSASMASKGWIENTDAVSVWKKAVGTRAHWIQALLPAGMVFFTGFFLFFLLSLPFLVGLWLYKKDAIDAELFALPFARWAAAHSFSTDSPEVLTGILLLFGAPVLVHRFLMKIRAGDSPKWVSSLLSEEFTRPLPGAKEPAFVQSLRSSVWYTFFVVAATFSSKIVFSDYSGFPEYREFRHPFGKVPFSSFGNMDFGRIAVCAFLLGLFFFRSRMYEKTAYRSSLPGKTKENIFSRLVRATREWRFFVVLSEGTPSVFFGLAMGFCNFFFFALLYKIISDDPAGSVVITAPQRVGVFLLLISEFLASFVDFVLMVLTDMALGFTEEKSLSVWNESLYDNFPTVSDLPLWLFVLFPLSIGTLLIGGGAAAQSAGVSTRFDGVKAGTLLGVSVGFACLFYIFFHGSSRSDAFQRSGVFFAFFWSMFFGAVGGLFYARGRVRSISTDFQIRSDALSDHLRSAFSSPNVKTSASRGSEKSAGKSSRSSGKKSRQIVPDVARPVVQDPQATVTSPASAVAPSSAPTPSPGEKRQSAPRRTGTEEETTRKKQPVTPVVKETPSAVTPRSDRQKNSESAKTVQHPLRFAEKPGLHENAERGSAIPGDSLSGAAAQQEEPAVTSHTTPYSRRFLASEEDFSSKEEPGSAEKAPGWSSAERSLRSTESSGRNRFENDKKDDRGGKLPWPEREQHSDPIPRWSREKTSNDETLTRQSFAAFRESEERFLQREASREKREEFAKEDSSWSARTRERQAGEKAPRTGKPGRFSDVQPETAAQEESRFTRRFHDLDPGSPSPAASRAPLPEEKNPWRGSQRERLTERPAETIGRGPKKGCEHSQGFPPETSSSRTAERRADSRASEIRIRSSIPAPVSFDIDDIDDIDASSSQTSEEKHKKGEGVHLSCSSSPERPFSGESQDDASPASPFRHFSASPFPEKTDERNDSL